MFVESLIAGMEPGEGRDGAESMGMVGMVGKVGMVQRAWAKDRAEE